METVAIYLGVIVACGLLARVVKLPTLVGYLAAGFVLHAAGQPIVPALDTVADLGVTILLFTIGLKLNLRMLFRREVVVTSAVNLAALVAATTGLLGVLGLLGVGLLDGVGLGTLAVLGFALSFSSTVFVVQVLDDRSESHSLYGRIAIGILVLQDVVAVVYLTVAGGGPPSPWAVTLLLLLPAVWLLRRVWDHVGHSELQTLFGITVALVPGYLWFHSVGLEGDFGALLLGLALASHTRAGDLSHALFGLREVLLVAFFVSLGLAVSPTPQTVALGVGLVLVLPVEGYAFAAVLALFGLRHRTAILAGLALANFSEFGLIVVAEAVGHGSLPADWLVVVSVAVATSFVVSSVLNRRGTGLVELLGVWLPDPRRGAHPEDAPIEFGDAAAVVLGMGRVGRAAYERLAEEYELAVVGVENDPVKVESLRADGLCVLEADATEADFWDRVDAGGHVGILVLAMPFHGSNLASLERIETSRFDGVIAAVARYDDERDELLAHGADVAFHIYEGTGVGLADALAEHSALDPSPALSRGLPGTPLN